MQFSIYPFLPIFLFAAGVIGLAIVLLVVANVFNPVHPGRVKGMPYESGMDPFHDTRRRFDIRFHLLAIAFMVFDVEILFLYPWAVALRPAIENMPSVAPAAAKAPAAAESAPAKPPVGLNRAVEKGWIENRNIIFIGAMFFILLLVLGFVYDWRKGVFNWR